MRDPSSIAPRLEQFEPDEAPTGVRVRDAAFDDIADFLPLVERMATRMARNLPPSVLREDLVAAGALGLLDASRRFVGDRGANFEWYARVRIRGAMIDELRTLDWLSRHERSKARAHAALGDADAFSIVGLDDLPEQQRSGATRDSMSPAGLTEKRMDRQALSNAILGLPEREARIVSLHYVDGVPFKEIAQRLGVSEPRISQLHTRALKMLHETMLEVTPSCAS
jgi:RNA polymerase sigma factor for flagellar operon FliA